MDHQQHGLDETVISLLQKADWERISLELTDYAIKKALRCYWRTGTYTSDLPEGKTPEDIVYEAIEKILDVSRRWDSQKNPDLLSYLKAVVDSLINHLYESEDNKKIQRFPQTQEGVDLEEVLDKADPDCESAKNFSHPSINPEEILLREERREIEEKILDDLFKSIQGDRELEQIIDCIMDGKTKPREIAETTGMDIKQVYQLMRKLKRKAITLGKNKKSTW